MGGFLLIVQGKKSSSHLAGGKLDRDSESSTGNKIIVEGAHRILSLFVKVEQHKGSASSTTQKSALNNFAVLGK